MFKKLKNSQGQGVGVQYALTFFLVVATVAGMSLYVQRTLQARIRGATRMVPLVVANATEIGFETGYLVGDISIQYEPYYLNTVATRQVTSRETRQLRDTGIGTSGSFQHDVDQTVSVGAVSGQASPRRAPAVVVNASQRWSFQDYVEKMHDPAP
ncbi:MAG: hypothetical protein NUV91_04870 [Candidatus Omnitrophica bacterium]|nr:hypothetical protein [Candidatus Omnitrophota bacterium]